MNVFRNGYNWAISVGSTAESVVALGNEKDSTLTMNTNMIDVTGKNPDGAKEVYPGISDFTLDANGAYLYGDTADDALMIAYANKTKVYFTAIDNVNGDSYSGSGYLSKAVITAPIEDVVRGSITLTGSGKLTYASSILPTPPAP